MYRPFSTRAQTSEWNFFEATGKKIHCFSMTSRKNVQNVQNDSEVSTILSLKWGGSLVRRWHRSHQHFFKNLRKLIFFFWKKETIYNFFGKSKLNEILLRLLYAIVERRLCNDGSRFYVVWYPIYAMIIILNFTSYGNPQKSRYIIISAKRIGSFCGLSRRECNYTNCIYIDRERKRNWDYSFS